MALRIALSSVSSSNGLVKNSTAPAFMARTVIGTSPWPVMKMIGISVRSAAIRFCKSKPLRSGRLTSSTRQLGTLTRGRARNSCADANVSGSQPSQRISASNDSRTERSSSTTKTIGVSRDMSDDLDSRNVTTAQVIVILHPITAKRSFHSKSDVNGIHQSRLAEWFEQARRGTVLEQARTDRLVSEGCDEHDRNLLPAKHQLALEIRAGHARHGDVEDQALGLPDGIGREEFLCRREHRDRKAEFAQQVRQRLAHGLVVIDDRNQWMHNHHILLVRCCAPVARSPALGMENENVAPGPSSFGAAHRRPRCRSMMKRLTDKPMPMPSLLVV